MNTAAVAAAIRSSTSAPTWARVRDFVELTKPRLSLMVLVTVAVTMLVCDADAVNLGPIAWVLVSTGLVAASACVWNQVAERHIDSLMVRTSDRPLPAGRVGPGEATTFAALMLVLGCGGLLLVGGIWSAALGLVTWLIYVLIYTPMKQRSAWNTFFGAIAGATPVLIGWSATATPLAPASGLKALILFSIVFAWQFPHFMAIAWRYREDYAAASIRMASVVDSQGWLAGAVAVLGAAALLPVASALAWLSPRAPVYLAVTLLLSLWFLWVTCRFAVRRDDRSARSLLRASLVYLPLVLLSATLLPLM